MGRLSHKIIIEVKNHVSYNEQLPEMRENTYNIESYTTEKVIWPTIVWFTLMSTGIFESSNKCVSDL